MDFLSHSFLLFPLLLVPCTSNPVTDPAPLTSLPLLSRSRLLVPVLALGCTGLGNCLLRRLPNCPLLCRSRSLFANRLCQASHLALRHGDHDVRQAPLIPVSAPH